ncbi:MAG: hypothetical protein FWD62_13160 [Betaproteobacteria bacterium]|nr:hypothetical protein [Betaproteobacteria bacterium]
MKIKTISHFTAGILLAAVAVSHAQAQISVSVGVPGFYGAIDIGNAPPPALIYQQPVAVQPAAVGIAPLYLYVPPEQYGRWGEYCGRYNACNRPVYFVDRNWYQRVYVPHYQNHRSYYDQRRPEFDRQVGHRPPPPPDSHRPPVREVRRDAAPQSYNNQPPHGNPPPRGNPHYDNRPGNPPPQSRDRHDNEDRRHDNRDRDRH